MRVAILETRVDQRSATGVRGRAMCSYLSRHGHTVDVIAPDPGVLTAFRGHRFSLLARIARRLLRRKTLPHLWDSIARDLKPRVQAGGYDVVIGRDQECGYVLTELQGPQRLLDVANIKYLEEYYCWGPDLANVAETFEKESAVIQAADYILSPHVRLTDYLCEVFPKIAGIREKTVTVRLGTDRAKRRAEPAEPGRIVYAGSYYYIQDPILLATLARLSPIPIHCYGPTDPNAPFLPARLDFMGYREDLDFLADYQLGLITVSRDRLRQHSPATKFAYYFAHGLPVLFPEWMLEGHDYPACAISYTEETFQERVLWAMERDRWREMSDGARRVANELLWDKVLAPLLDLIEPQPGDAAQHRSLA